jgi:hypothetical protein
MSGPSLAHEDVLKGRTMNKHLLLASFALTAILAVAEPAQAAPMKVMKTAWASEAKELQASDLAKPAPVTTYASPTEEISDPVLGLEDLEALAGEGLNDINVITGQTLTAITAGNTINAGTVGSGAITLGPNAFSGFDGIGNFVINSGHNNTLQSSLSVSIVLAP